MQVYVPGLSPLAVTVSGSPTPVAGWGELPIFALLELTQLMLLCVPPLASEATWTVRSVSGVSVAENVASFPSPHVEFVPTVTVWAVRSSIEYPAGAAVSVTE